MWVYCCRLRVSGSVHDYIGYIVVVILFFANGIGDRTRRLHYNSSLLPLSLLERAWSAPVPAGELSAVFC